MRSQLVTAQGKDSFFDGDECGVCDCYLYEPAGENVDRLLLQETHHILGTRLN